MKTKSNAAFTFVEILMVLALIGILTVVSVTSIESVTNDVSFDKTYQRMTLIKMALVGDLDTNKQGLRQYYGYLGDMGELPSAAQGLQALLAKPATAQAYSINSTSFTGMGWRGPYLKGTTGVDWLEDAWGNELEYETTGNPTITSLGSDGEPGGIGTASDIVIELPESVRTGSVFGVINRNGNVHNFDAVAVPYEPNGNGALKTLDATRRKVITAGSGGAFSFDNVSSGLRSVKIYMPNDSGATPEVIGPSIIGVDNVKYQIPHNFMDATPGAMPHVCSDFTAASFVGSTFKASDSTKRVYFDINIANSMTINSIYVQTNSDRNVVAVRIGNDTKSCASVGGLICCTRSGNNANCDPDDDGVADESANEMRYFPEMALRSNWTIKAENPVGAYVEFSTANVSTLEWIRVRLGCDMVFAQ